MVIRKVIEAKEKEIKHQSENSDQNFKTNFQNGTQLYNANGTDGDIIKINGTEFEDAIDAWKEYCGKAVKIEKCPNAECTSDAPSDIVGAHVVKNSWDVDVKRGDKIYIIPLCRGCNSAGDKKKIRLNKTVEGLSLIFDANLSSNNE